MMMMNCTDSLPNRPPELTDSVMINYYYIYVKMFFMVVYCSESELTLLSEFVLHPATFRLRFVPSLINQSSDCVGGALLACWEAREKRR